MTLISFQKSIPCSQVGCLNRICSNHVLFDQECNNLDHWLHERRHSERVVRQEILKSKKIPRYEWLQQERNQQEQNKLMFNILYYFAFQNIETFLEELQILHASDKDHPIVFLNAPNVGCHSGKSLKDRLVRISLSILNNTLGSKPCWQINCQACQLVVN